MDAPDVALNVMVAGSALEVVRFAVAPMSRVVPLVNTAVSRLVCAKAGATIKRRRTKELRQVEKADRRVVTLNFCKNTLKRAILRVVGTQIASLSLSLSHFYRSPYNCTSLLYCRKKNTASALTQAPTNRHLSHFEATYFTEWAQSTLLSEN